ncbi:MAG: hypothetical protein Q9187_005248 [Circinaria calcarea]
MNPLQIQHYKGRAFYKVVPESLIPSDWCNDPDLLDAVPDAQELNDYGYETRFINPIPILGQADDALYLFKDGDKFYFWGGISSCVHCVDSPKDIIGILDCLTRNWEEEGFRYHEIEAT